MDNPAQDIKEPVACEPEPGDVDPELEVAEGSPAPSSTNASDSIESGPESEPVSVDEQETPAEGKIGVESMPPPTALIKHVELKKSTEPEATESSDDLADESEEPGDLEDAKASEQLVAFLKTAPKLADAISSLRKEKKELAHNAARALHHAFAEWSIVSEGLQRQPKPKIVDRSEEQLVHYWKAAALAVSQFDEKRGKRCEATAELLANISKLTKVELKMLTGRLEEACRKFDMLLSARLWVTGQTGRPTPPQQS